MCQNQWPNGAFQCGTPYITFRIFRRFYFSKVVHFDCNYIELESWNFFGWIFQKKWYHVGFSPWFLKVFWFCSGTILDLSFFVPDPVGFGPWIPTFDVHHYEIWNLSKLFEKSQYASIRRYLTAAKARCNTRPRYIELMAIERNLVALELEDDSEEIITDEINSI